MNRNDSSRNINYSKRDVNNNKKYNVNNNTCRNRKRKRILFNHPFCKLSIINKGKYFLDLIDERFHRENPLSKIFYRNTIKISYSCINDISKIIYNHD